MASYAPAEGYPPQAYPGQPYPGQPQPYPGQPYQQQPYIPTGYPPPQAYYPPQQPVVVNMVQPPQMQVMAARPTVVVASNRYDYTIAMALAIIFPCFLGIHGVHRCYLGMIGSGILQFFTFGGCWIWTLIDWCNMQSLVNEANGISNSVVVVS